MCGRLYSTPSERNILIGATKELWAAQDMHTADATEVDDERS